MSTFLRTAIRCSLVAGLTACAGPRSGSSSDPVSPTPSGGQPSCVARVGGKPLTTAEFLQAWLHQDSPGVRALLDELILERLVRLEAERLRIGLDPDESRDVKREAMERLDREVLDGGSGLSGDEFLAQRLGLNPGPYRDRIAARAELDLLAQRVVRAWLLCSEHAHVSVIVVETREQVTQVQQELAAGARFEDLARTWSVDESGTQGGRVPPVVRGRTPLALLAFETAVGEVGGPVREGERWLVLRVDSRPPPLSPNEPERLARAVGASLLERPIEDPEFWQWKAAVVLLHDVDMAPFFQWMGNVAVD